MTDFKLPGPLHVLCFLFFVIYICNASGGSKLARFLYDKSGDDNCGCQIGKCVHLSNGGFRCDCYDPAWTGERCDILAWTLTSTHQPKQQGSLDHCYLNCGHGHCAVHPDPLHHWVHYCECDHGWYGEHCMIQQTQPLHMDHCYNHCQHGACVGTDMFGYHCQCDPGWYGMHCEEYREPMHMDLCNNHCQHGICVGPDMSGFSHCQCDYGWYGGHCEHHWGNSNTGNLPSTESTTNTPPTTTTRTTTTMRTTTTKATATTTKATTTTTTTPKPTPIVTTQSPVSATSSIHVIVTTTHSVSGVSVCDKSALLTSVATQTAVVNQNAEECSTGSHSSHDALVLTHCQVPNSASSWKQGTNVMSHCTGSASLPTYTAIAAFDNGMYSSKGSLSGVFLGCTANGFKMAFQSCGQPPQIAEINMGGTNTLDPVVYYTVV